MLDIIYECVGNKESIVDIANSRMLPLLLVLLDLLNTREQQQFIISIISALMSSSDIVLETIQTGGLIYLLDMYANTSTTEVYIYRERES